MNKTVEPITGFNLGVCQCSMFCETKPTNPEFLDTSKMDIVLSPGDFEGRNVQRGIRYSCLGSMG